MYIFTVLISDCVVMLGSGGAACEGQSSGQAAGGAQQPEGETGRFPTSPVQT